VSRADLRRVLAATYHQVWWPDTSVVRFDGDELPVWDDQAATYLDPTTGEVLPTWDDALDAIGNQDEPLHVARFGDRFDAQGVLSGSKDAARCIGYLTKYLNKQVADCHQAQTDAQRAHVDRLADALRYEPCSPRGGYLGCAMWRRYLALAHGCTASHKDGPVKYTAHELRHVCASLLIASGAADMQVTNQMGHSKIETTKNIYGNPLRPGPGADPQGHERGRKPSLRPGGRRGGRSCLTGRRETKTPGDRAPGGRLVWGGGPWLDSHGERLSAGLFARGPHGLRARSLFSEGQGRGFGWWAVQDLNL